MLLLSKYLGLEDEFQKNGIFDIALDMDSNYFINIKMLEKASEKEFKSSYRKINDFFNDIYLLLKVSSNSNDRSFKEARKKFNFPEKIKLGLGYSKTIYGTGLTGKLASKVLYDAKEIIDKGIVEPEIFNLIGLFEEGIGPDRLSDMYSLIIKDDIIKYTKKINKKLFIDKEHYPSYLFKDEFLINPNTNQIILLLPKEILHELPIAYEWEDVSEACEKINTIKNEINKIISKNWSDLTKKEKQKITKKEIIFESIMKNPKVVSELVEEFKKFNIERYDFDTDKIGNTKIYNFFNNEFDKNQVKDEIKNVYDLDIIVQKICNKFKDLIENNSISKLLYDEDETFRNEKHCQLLFYGIAESYCEANDLDISPETNSGRGSVDFKFSKGYSKRVVAELKLTSNNQLIHGLTTQIKEYEKSEKTNNGVYVVIDNKQDEKTVERLIKEYNCMKEEFKPTMIIVDPKIKSSASIY